MIEILRPGLQSTIQDGGRRGFQAYGVPVGGAMDRHSMWVANILAGNPWEEAVLEICALGPAIRFHCEGIFALAGADCSAKLNGQALKNNSAFLVNREDVLELGACTGGLRAYLAAAGGFDLPLVLSSRSTCLSAGFGGFEGRSLKTGDRLALREPQLWLRGLPERCYREALRQDGPIGVVIGPQDGAFSQEGLDTFFRTSYRLGKQCDRMGCRLEGEAIKLKDGVSPNIISDGIAMGSIQVPNGQPIVMMADRQTTGGYAKLGTVITADLPRMGQKRPGDQVRFSLFTVEEAQQAFLDQRRRLRNFQTELDRPDRW